MIAADLAFAPAGELARLVRERAVSPVELVRTYLERIDRWDARLHAYVTVAREASLSEAKAAEGAVARGERVGPLHGVPIGVKDQFLTRGLRTTNGTRTLAEFVPDEDATAVTRLREAGAIVLGKLNMPEGGMLGTRDWPFGQPRNPWDTDHDAGASSTGGGIAVAAALCAAALGEDTGGSIRNPASYNGVVGVRPTWGRVSRHGIMPLVWSMDTAGPMTRTVADSALILGVIAGHDPRDVFSARLPVPDYVAALDGDVRGLRVGIIRELFESGFLDQETAAAVRAAAAALAGLGATVDEVSLPTILLGGAIFCAIADSGTALQHREELLLAPERFDAGPRRRMLAASLLPVALYLKVEQARNLMRDQIRGALERFDVLLCPSAPAPAARIDRAQVATWTTEDLIRFWQRGSHTSPFSLAAVPALSVPCGLSGAGLPIGMQLVGRPFGEATILRAAHAYEAVSDVRTRRPPLS
ncbi:MAG TPA: amidase [Candidatus Limnocylindria bacterium]|nr:amidase [Candidatus Limnocylindria bacterium]